MKENFNSQEYRDNLADAISSVKKVNPKEAETLLQKEKETEEYKVSRKEVKGEEKSIKIEIAEINKEIEGLLKISEIYNGRSDGDIDQHYHVNMKLFPLIERKIKLEIPNARIMENKQTARNDFQGKIAELELGDNSKLRWVFGDYDYSRGIGKQDFGKVSKFEMTVPVKKENDSVINKITEDYNENTKIATETGTQIPILEFINQKYPELKDKIRQNDISNNDPESLSNFSNAAGGYIEPYKILKMINDKYSKK